MRPQYPGLQVAVAATEVAYRSGPAIRNTAPAPARVEGIPMDVAIAKAVATARVTVLRRLERAAESVPIPDRPVT
jgi:hypothetical protein